MSRPSHRSHVTWDLERRNDVVIVGFEPLASKGWSELFEATKAEVDAGAHSVVFPTDMPSISPSGMAIFQELVRYLIRSGVAVNRAF
jgi:hypothetical protein